MESHTFGGAYKDVDVTKWDELVLLNVTAQVVFVCRKGDEAAWMQTA